MFYKYLIADIFVDMSEKNFVDIERVHSCIWGGVIGDAIGLGTEFMTKDQIKQYYNSKPYTYNDIIQDQHRTSWEKSDWSDDTDQMLVVMNTIMSSSFNEYATTFSKQLTNWRQNGIVELGDKFGGVGLGKPVAWVMNEDCFIKDPKKAAKNVWDVSEYTENGSQMRQNIIGTMNKPLQEVIDTSVEFCLTTHSDPRTVGCCVFAVIVVYYFVRRELDVKKVMDIAREKSIIEMKKLNYCTEYNIQKFNSFFDDIPDISVLNLEKPQIRSTTKQTFRCLIYALQRIQKGTFENSFGASFSEKSFEDILWSVVLEGGDSDTNACVVGGVLGAYFGKVPKALIDGLIYKNYMSDKIEKWIKFNNY